MRWSLFKERSEDDLTEAELLEQLKTEITSILRDIDVYISHINHIKESDMERIHRAMSTKEIVMGLIRSRNIPSYRSRNAELINKIEGIFSILKTSRKDIVTMAQAVYIKNKCQEVIREIKSLLRGI